MRVKLTFFLTVFAILASACDQPATIKEKEIIEVITILQQRDVEVILNSLPNAEASIVDNLFLPELSEEGSRQPIPDSKPVCSSSVYLIETGDIASTREALSQNEAVYYIDAARGFIGTGNTAISLDDSPQILAQDLSVTGKGSVIAVIDSGLGSDKETSQSLFGNRIYSPVNFTRDGDNLDKEAWFDFAEDNNGEKNNLGHGTAVAYIASRIASDALIMPIKACSSESGATICRSEDIIASICYALNNAPNDDVSKLVINMSFSREQPSETLYGAIKYAISQGAKVVVSSGNRLDTNFKGWERASKVYPAGYGADSEVGAAIEGLIVVAGFDLIKKIPSMESLGGGYVDLTAQAVNVESVRSDGIKSNFIGTSFSAAQVSGAVAALIELFPNFNALDMEKTLKTSYVENPRCSSPCSEEEVGVGLLRLDEVLFSDDFEGDLSKWDLEGTGIELVEDVNGSQGVCIKAESDTFPLLLAGDEEWENYDIYVDVMINSFFRDEGAASLYFRAKPLGIFYPTYLLDINNDSFGFVREFGSEGVRTESVSLVNRDIENPVGQLLKLKIEVRGQNLLAELKLRQETARLRFFDEDSPILTGQLALSAGSSETCFDNVIVFKR